MNKKEVVELESAFLDFMEKAESLGFYFTQGSEIVAANASSLDGLVRAGARLANDVGSPLAPTAPSSSRCRDDH